MDLSTVRALAQGLSFEAHGVPATVTRPAPDNTPIATRVIWPPTQSAEAHPYGRDLPGLDALVLVLRRDEVPTAPRGTTIAAPRRLGQATETWKVDGVEGADDGWLLRRVVTRIS